MVPSQDHKAIFEDDRGPNTGGMGAFSADFLLSDELRETILSTIIEPTVQGMAKQGTPFSGILYAGLMLTDEGPKVRIPSSLIDKALKTAPSTVVLGARDPGNKLILDAHEARVRFGSGSETNVWLEARFDNGLPEFIRKKVNIIMQTVNIEVVIVYFFIIF